MHSNKFFYIFIVVILIFAFYPRANTEEPTVVTVGYYLGFNIIKNPNSLQARGFGYDILQKIGRELNIQFEFVELNSSAFDAVANEEVDIAGLFVKNPEREKKVVFSSSAYNQVQYGLATKGNQNVFYDDPASIDGKKVATFFDSYANDLLDDYLHQNNISVQYVYGDVDSYTELDADYYLIYTDNDRLVNFYTILNLGVSYTHFITSEKNQSLMNQIDAAYKNIVLNDNNFIEDLQSKYRNLGGEFRTRSLRREEAELLKGKTFTVGYTSNHTPYQYTNKNGAPAGMIIDILNMLASDYGFSIDYKPYIFSNGTANHSEFDLLVSILGETEDASQYYQSTYPYYNLPLVMLLKEKGNFKSLQDLKNNKSRIGLPYYIDFDYNTFYEDFLQSKITLSPSYEGLINSLTEETIDGILLIDSGADYARLSFRENVLIQPTDLVLPLKFHLSNKTAEEYMDIFNTILSRVNDTEFYRIRQKHIEEFLPAFDIRLFFIKNIIYFIIIAFTILLAILLSIIYSQKNYKEKIVKILQTDELTGHLSLRYFRELVVERLQNAGSSEYEIISFDIDFFRLINNYFGMETGTKVIKGLADALRKAYSQTSTLIAHGTADKFILFGRVDECEDIERIVSLYLQPAVKEIVGKQYNLSMSIGIYKIAGAAEDINTLIDYSDIARSKGKKQHRTTYTYFDEKMRKEYIDTATVTYKMEGGLRNNEFKMVFQPKINLTTLEICGAEALVRWHQEGQEPIYPYDFIPIMEANGFVLNLDLYVFEEVCRFLNENYSEYPVPKIAINMSAITLSEPSIIDSLMRIVEKYRVKPRELEIELPESAWADFGSVLDEKVKTLKHLGFSIAMDDFGTGISSLNRLSDINIDIIKLDNSFLEHNQHTEKGTIVIEEIMALTKRLEISVIAEGTETLEQAKWLRSLKCDIAQGFYFSKPLDEEEFKLYLKEDNTYTLD